jgi:type I site-specific restriction-modification system R (restriction) subunit
VHDGRQQAISVKSLSRLNRARPKKSDVFVLDFMNDAETIRKAFEPYYRTTILSGETDPNKLHDLKSALDASEVYDEAQQVDQFVTLYLGGADRDRLDPTLDACVTTYKEQLSEDDQVDFKGKAKAFVRTYAFLASILPYTNASWEKLPQSKGQLNNDIRTVFLASARHLVSWKIDVCAWHRQCYRMASYFDRQVGAPSGPTLDQCA